MDKINEVMVRLGSNHDINRISVQNYHLEIEDDKEK
jgi:hypothetical protein